MNEDIADSRNQDRSWSRHAASYEEIFLDPFGPDVENPIWDALDAIPEPGVKTAADLGCGTGTLLPALARRFGRVVALDFAAGMLRRARERVDDQPEGKVTFLQRPMHELSDMASTLDVAIAVNSLVMPDERQIDRTLAAIRRSLRPVGVFLGVVPSLDAIQYHTLLLLDQALEHGLEPADARRFAAYHAEHRYYDFVLGRFKFQGLRQKFWQPFELEYRLRKAGFHSVSLAKVLYPWEESSLGTGDFRDQAPSWDWFFTALP